MPFQDNRLILVGENGTGKSTVANALYFFLSRQWKRLSQYEFESISLKYEANGVQQQLKLTSSEISDVPARRLITNRLFRKIPPHYWREIEPLLLNSSMFDLVRDASLFDYLSEIGIPREYIREFRNELAHGIEQEFHAEHGKMNSSDIRQIEEKLSETIDAQILYLPTYRRIERDLEYIFPNLVQNEVRGRRRRAVATPDHYVELVEFGMQDVARTIRETMSQLGAELRNRLNALTGTYLREVVRREYRDVNVDQLRDLNEEKIAAVLDRVGENLLTRKDKETLIMIIRKVGNNEAVDNEDKAILHFLIRLISLHERQQELETTVIDFVDVCNNYLIGKQLEYDSRQFVVDINMKGPRTKNSRIELAQLSSGEKQIISLFAHIYLSRQTKFFVIIDEPELSLSVKWQRRFLPDILATERCSGLVAVTHSPFIFDNSLSQDTHGIEEFWVRKK
jgi:predicted ATPase